MTAVLMSLTFVMLFSLSKEVLPLESDEPTLNLSGCSRPLASTSCAMQGKYRSISGVCNNRKQPNWGAANSPLARWLAAEYEDGQQQPKGWNTGHLYRGFLLPPVREVSRRIMRSSSSSVLLDPLYSQMLVDWGQYISHDISFTPQSTRDTSLPQGLDCLETCSNEEPCFPVQLPEAEHVSRNRSCLPFFRSLPARQGSHQDIIPRQQINAASSFIDASTVYGSSAAVERTLRERRVSDVLLAVGEKLEGAHTCPLLPPVSFRPSGCLQEPPVMGLQAASPRVECFRAGDSRVNEVLPLSVLHTLWLREHNRLAPHLRALNAHWDSERVYQETRKIITALHQVITMRDYVPKILGQDAFDKYIGQYVGYDEIVDPSVSNVFATAAFRFGHATISPRLWRLNESFQEDERFPSLRLQQSFFSPWRLAREGGLDPVLRGLLVQPAVLQNHLMAEDLTQRLMVLNIPEPLDLAALNLQRGRDHGLPGYNAWRAFCGFATVESHAELLQAFGSAYLVQNTLDLYGHADNIDVWLGGLLEQPLSGARTGPLFTCLIGKQMKNLRDGDRLWWENPGVFSSEQRQELQKHSLSRLICDNSGLSEVPLDAFRACSYPDDFLSCENIPALDLLAWKEQPR